MTTREIAQNEWTVFFDTFSKEHQGLIGTVEVISSDIGALEEARALPFVGISAETKGSLRILLGTEAADHIDHTVSAPVQVWLPSAGDGARDSLAIESKDRSRTILQLRPIPALSE